MQRAIIIDNLSVSYQQHHALAQVNVAIEQGALVAIVGPNGAGKTTLIEALLNFIPITTGSIKLFGTSHKTQKNICAYVPQRTGIDWDFPISALEVVLMGTYGKLG